MEYIEFSAKTVSDCITESCKSLGVTSDKLEYEGVEEGSSKLKRITYSISPLNYSCDFKNEHFEIEITDMTITSIS